MLRFCKGRIVHAEYSTQFDETLQDLQIEEDESKAIYNTLRIINKDENLLGVGDKVSFLLNDDTIIFIRLNFGC